MGLPTISVVVSVYNGQRYLRESVGSVLAQTFTDFELIVVNDGSTDGSREILAEYETQDSRLRVIDQENQGLTRALIHGCGEARGRYIARHDADDLSLPARLTAQASMLDGDPTIGFVSCRTEYVGPEDEPLGTICRPADVAEATRQLLDERQGPPAHGSVMFRKSLYLQVGGYRDAFHFGQDSDLWLRMAEQSRIAYVQDCLYLARRHPDSVSGAHQSLQTEFGRLGQLCRTARREGQSDEPYLEAARRLSAQIRTSGMGYAANGRDEVKMAYLIGSQLARRGDRRAAKYLWNVIRQSPWHWRAWVRLAQCYATRKRTLETLDDT